MARSCYCANLLARSKAASFCGPGRLTTYLQSRRSRGEGPIFCVVISATRSLHVTFCISPWTLSEVCQQQQNIRVCYSDCPSAVRTPYARPRAARLFARIYPSGRPRHRLQCSTEMVRLLIYLQHKGHASSTPPLARASNTRTKSPPRESFVKRLRLILWIFY